MARGKPLCVLKVYGGRELSLQQHRPTALELLMSIEHTCNIQSTHSYLTKLMTSPPNVPNAGALLLPNLLSKEVCVLLCLAEHYVRELGWELIAADI